MTGETTEPSILQVGHSHNQEAEAHSWAPESQGETQCLYDPASGVTPRARGPSENGAEWVLSRLGSIHVERNCPY